MFENKVLLDTCALLWLASDDVLLSVHARDAIECASVVYVSAISAWEISLKQQLGNLILPVTAEKWFTRTIAHHNLVVTPLDIDILFAANMLPWHHRDPADRFIIATAKKEKCAVVTRDKRFELYEIKLVQ
jgi:PIN domain nuclease of toxin-antitoxin system